MTNEEKQEKVEPTEAKPSEPKKEAPTKKSEKVAVILVRGMVKVNKEIKDTTYMLRLRKKNCCVILEKTESMMGMLNKIKYYVTWGDVSDETIKKLVEKKGQKGYFNLNSPKKGFGRKGIKTVFKLGGALGDRGDKINDLIERMLG
ncbi:50S ribosomal protein L30 [Candidatus Woesearchaeota archaeon]|jgi:large subunit ribosomal protein L30|nr:50S ribosomal protein L30 [Candidatus Woesearchaeota archaeon]MBT4368699.1 50S ribosomal protein L30 [Candidatus Woesearchaeota archaeon]MBT4711988.1 50S ribosomal protein L30 [Candidatus Woesearchaeota archaeon]MBT6638883.1 50S ribosomal protein L30 [Candidatus Woesearchaeota archaeon]MBT7134527.1 50S ribosomal protein L30 [Candidatus Woesearchaeota archaeon]